MVDRFSDLGRRALIAWAVAIAWSIAVWFAAFSVPVYSSEGASSDGTVVDSGVTLVGENGLSAVVVISVPLVVSLLVGATLAFVAWPAGRVLAWVLTGLLAALNVLALLSIGIFVLPVTIALVVTCATSRQPQPARSS